MNFKNLKRGRCYVIAEIGGNFTDLETAKRLIDEAARSKVDAVKLQTYRAATLSTKSAVFDMENTGVQSQFEIFKKYEISEELHKQVIDHVRIRGLDWFSTPSHQTDVDMLERLGVPLYKVGSDDAVNLPFLTYLAKKNKPIILSTGMCQMREVRESVNAIRKAGNKRIALLHAITSYPTHPEDVNLLAMNAMMKEFPDLAVGYSDHTIGITACLGAVALGAKIIEKHFTFDKKAEGPDHVLSADPAEMAELVKQIHILELMLGDGKKTPARSERITRINNRKSIVTNTFIKKGEFLTAKNLAIKRPGSGIEPKYWKKVLRKRAGRDLAEDTLLAWKDIR